MEAAYLYSKPRSEFGKDVRACLRVSSPRLLAHLPGLGPEEATALVARQYVRRNPCSTEVDNTPSMSEHEVNTARSVLKSSSMRHIEGGWPKDVDASEQADVTRFRKKVEKDEDYKAAVKALGPLLVRGLKQNNTVDIYEEYFASSSGVTDSDAVAATSITAAAVGAASKGLVAPAASSPRVGGSGSGGGSGSSSARPGGSTSAATAVVDASLASDPPSAKGLAVFRDPCPVKRAATMLNWHPEGQGKLAVAYSLLNFQDPRFLLPSTTSSSSSSSSHTNRCTPSSSFIWDVHSPNKPDVELLPPSPLCALRYNPKSTDTLVGGCYNGLVCLFDLRKPGALVQQTSSVVSAYSSHHSTTTGCPPLDASLLEKSHHDPVYDVHWVSSKTGNQCVSASTDGQLLWWDTRRLADPTDALLLTANPSSASAQPSPRPPRQPQPQQQHTQQPLLLGASALEYSVEAGPTKYVLGTEQGVVLGVNLRNRKQHSGPVATYDAGAGHRHHGPVYSLQRNPFHPKFFLTVGDWCAKLWSEDVKTPVLATRYHPAYLTRGCWSPTRPGVFFLARADGVVDVWDLFYHGATEAAYSHKVGDAALSSVAVQGSMMGGEGGGRLLGVGDAQGTVALLELCGGLADCQQGEKQAVGLMLEREAKQERNLEVRERELRRARAVAVAEEGGGDGGGGGKAGVVRGGGLGAVGAGKDEKMEELLRKVDSDFLAMLKESEGDDVDGMAARAGGGGDGGGGGEEKAGGRYY